ncbi:MAG: hypothetical protein HY350_02600 [Candidatus Omnitrophica bacterium]|nr:hypothetical protein [Candidatus Omnitrophota bacterium]
MAKVHVESGICGFKADIDAVCEDMQHVRLDIKTECPNFTEFTKEIKEVDAFQEIEPTGKNGKILSLWPKYLHCSACPVPSGIIKAVEVSAGLALPKDAVIKFET